MTLIWPKMLVAALAVPAMIATYVVLQRNRAERSRQLALSGLVLTGPAGSLGRRRHIPYVLFLLALSALVLALTRPQVVAAFPRQTGTVMLVIDVSASMLADDLEPTRLHAAQQAASDFIDTQPSGIDIGIVAFGDGAQLLVAPTDDRVEALDGVDRLSAAGGTSVGPAIFSALNAISGEPIALTEEDLDGDLGGVDIGFFGSAAIVLLSDGENTAGPDPVEVAQLAANGGVRITAIGVGSVEGSTIDVDGFQVATALDEAALQDIAALTGGDYFRATDNESLDAVYDSLDLQWTREGERVEITGPLAAGAIVLMLMGAGLSMRWFGRVV